MILHPKAAKNLKKKIEKGIINKNENSFKYSDLQNTFRRFGRFWKEFSKNQNGISMPHMRNQIYSDSEINDGDSSKNSSSEPEK